MTKRPPADRVPRGRGRPKADEPGMAVMTWVKVSDYDRIARLAHKRDVSVSSVVRSLLVRRLP